MFLSRFITHVYSDDRTLAGWLARSDFIDDRSVVFVPCAIVTDLDLLKKIE